VRSRAGRRSAAVVRAASGRWGRPSCRQRRAPFLAVRRRASFASLEAALGSSAARTHATSWYPRCRWLANSTARCDLPDPGDPARTTIRPSSPSSPGSACSSAVISRGRMTVASAEAKGAGKTGASALGVSAIRIPPPKPDAGPRPRASIVARVVRSRPATARRDVAANRRARRTGARSQQDGGHPGDPCLVRSSVRDEDPADRRRVALAHAWATLREHSPAPRRWSEVGSRFGTIAPNTTAAPVRQPHRRIRETLGGRGFSPRTRDLHKSAICRGFMRPRGRRSLIATHPRGAPGTKPVIPGNSALERQTAGATGLEPATSGVTGRRSNQLSYAPRGP
jgi:hypothetical protein